MAYRKLKIISLLVISTSVFSQWVQLNSGISTALSDICFPDANIGYVVGSSSIIVKTTNAGQNWVNINNPAFVNISGVYFVNPLTGYAVGESGRAIKTTDGGANWTVLTLPVGDNFGTVFASDANNVYIGASSGKILKSTDGGQNWNVQVTSPQEIIKIHFADANTGYAGCTNGLILKTTNGGSNWNQLTTGITQHVYGIYAVNIDTVYGGCDAGKIIKSTNGGSNWAQLNSGTSERLYKIFFTNSLTGTVVGLANTILRTTTGGSAWLTQQSGVSGLDIFGLWFTNTITGYICGSGGVILKTTTGGFPFPSQPVLTAPVNGATAVSLTPVLDWDTVTTADTYKLQLALDTSFSNLVIDTTSLVNTQTIVPPGRLTNYTTYYWHVRGVNIVGDGPYSTRFRFRTIASFPQAPNLLLPANNASNVSLTPTFDWDSNGVVLYYTLQAGLDTSFINPPVNVTGITVSTYSVSVPLQYNSRYFWHVSTTNEAGTSSFSSVFNFTTIFGPPSPPTLLSPPNNTVGVSLTPTFKWVEDISAINYRVQISSDSNFVQTPEADTTVTDSNQVTIRPGLLVNVHKYYWRVRTTNPIGQSPWSAVWNFFTLLSPPGPPQLVSPLNNAVNVNLTPTLDWDTVQYSQTFKVQLATDTLFSTSSLLFSIGGLPVSQYNIPGATLSNNTDYYWHVSASNGAGTGPYSATWKFRTVTSPPVAAPTLISPPNGAFNQSLTPTLDWNDVFGSQGYQLLVTSDSLFNSIDLDTTISPSQFTIPAGILQGTTPYFWKVRGFNIGGYGPFSVTWHFTTGIIGISQISGEIPKEFKLHNNFPNPFNPVTKIRFDIPSSHEIQTVKLVLFDLLGREIEVLVDSRLKPGYYEVSWDASKYPSGIYLCRITAGRYFSVIKMVVLK